ncbi:MAG: LCP family protein [Lachnospiraceae bacterium]|nr:LCP family protein [Lachnospiraceae bacterium]
MEKQTQEKEKKALTDKKAAANAKREAKKKENTLKKRRRNVLLVMGEIVLMLLLAIGCFGVSVLNSYAHEEATDVFTVSVSGYETVMSSTQIDVTDNSGNVIGTTSVEIPRIVNSTGFRNVLVLGTDAHNNTDVIVIVSISNSTGNIKMVSILRDTIMKMEKGTTRHTYDKVNAQYVQTNISDMLSMINRNLDLDISEYVIVDWYGVAVAITQLGGIELTIPNDTILGYFQNYHAETMRMTGILEPWISQPGTYNMLGTHAVAYARIRYGGFEDDGRAEHHREAIAKCLDKAKSILAQGDINRLINVAQTGLSNCKTNMTLPRILFTITQLNGFNVAGSRAFPLSYSHGRYLGNYYSKYGAVDVMVANDFAGEVKSLHEFLFNDPNYEPSDFIKEISYQMYKDKEGLD